MSDVIIVGGGASAIAAAMEFAERSVVPLILDVGVLPGDPVAGAGNFYDYKSTHDSFHLTIGERFQGLANLTGTRRVPVKLATPNAEYVTRGAERWAPVDEDGFHAVQSFAMGGLANAWGGGLYRFNHVDMDGFPIEPSDLDGYFDRLTAEIGITGDDDDLTPFFGSTAGLLPPIRFSYNMERLYNAYRRQKGRLPAALRLGRPRLAVLTEVLDGRAPIAYDNMEFWQETPAIYSPRHTLQKLIARQRVQYRNGVLVRSFTEEDGGVTVHATDVASETPLSFRGRVLVLAAGVINTSRIVLESFHDHQTRLPLLENPAVQIPFVLPGSVGRPLDTAAFGLTQLNLVWESESYGARCQGSLIELTSPLRAEFFASLPYAARANLALIRHLRPCMFGLRPAPLHALAAEERTPAHRGAPGHLRPRQGPAAVSLHARARRLDPPLANRTRAHGPRHPLRGNAPHEPLAPALPVHHGGAAPPDPPRIRRRFGVVSAAPGQEHVPRNDG
jgi:hypothetical protein